MTSLDPSTYASDSFPPSHAQKSFGVEIGEWRVTYCYGACADRFGFFSIVLFCLVFIGLFCFFYCCCFSHPRSVERIRPNIRPMQRLNSVFRNPGNFRLWNVLLHFVIPIALCNKIVALYNKKAVALCNDRPSGPFVIKYAVVLCNKLERDGGKIKKANNNKHNNNNNNNNSNNIPLNGFQHQFLKWCQRKVMTSTAAFWLQDLCRKV